MQQYYRLIQANPDFSRLWVAQVISLLGDWFNTIVLSVLVADYSGGSGLAVSAFLLARFLPPLLVGPFAGVLVDRMDRKKILVYSNYARTLIVLGFLLADSPDMLWLIYALTVIQFAISALFEPGQSAITPSLVHRDDLILANTLSSITWSSMLAVGAIIGGVVGAVFGPAIALLIDSATFAVAGYLISTIKTSGIPQKAERFEGDTDQGSLLDGLRYLIRNRATIAVIMIKGGGSIGNVDTLMTIYATNIFIIGANGQLSLGIMYSAFGVGAIIGPLLLNRINDGSIFRMTQLVLLGFLLAVAGWLLIGIANSLLIFALAILIRAMGGSSNWTYSSVIVQKTVPDQFLGRVFSLDFAVFQLSTVLSTIIHGFIIDQIRAQLREDNPFLRVHSSGLLNDALKIVQPLGVADLQMLTFGTALASLLPLILWAIIMPKMRRKHSLPAVAAAQIPTTP